MDGTHTGHGIAQPQPFQYGGTGDEFRFRGGCGTAGGEDIWGTGPMHGTVLAGRGRQGKGVLWLCRRGTIHFSCFSFLDHRPLRMGRRLTETMPCRRRINILPRGRLRRLHRAKVGHQCLGIPARHLDHFLALFVSTLFQLLHQTTNKSKRERDKGGVLGKGCAQTGPSQLLPPAAVKRSRNRPHMVLWGRIIKIP